MKSQEDGIWKTEVKLDPDPSYTFLLQFHIFLSLYNSPLFPINSLLILADALVAHSDYEFLNPEG